MSKELLKEASDPSTLPQRLEEIYNTTKNYKIKIAVASNPNIPPYLIMDTIHNNHMLNENPVIQLMLLEDPSLLTFPRYTKPIKKINKNVLEILYNSYLITATYPANIFYWFNSLLSCDQIINIIDFIKNKNGNLYSILWQKDFYISLFALTDEEIVKIIKKYPDTFYLAQFIKHGASKKSKNYVRRILNIALNHAVFKSDFKTKKDTKRKIVKILLEDMSDSDLNMFMRSAKYDFAWIFNKD